MKASYSPPKRKSTPAVLIIFDRGFDALPAVVPNGGNEELDEFIIQWVQKKLLKTQNPRRAAA